jgi:hypothetical protein
MNRYDESLADVLKSTVNDAHELLRGEINLAKTEMREEISRITAGAALLAAAAAGALLALVFLLTAAAGAIAAFAGWPVWIGFAVIGVLTAVAAVVAGFVGRGRLNGHRHMPLTVDTLKENMQWIRAQKV